MVRLTRGERFKDARIVYNQHKKQTMDEVSAATGVSKSIIQSLEDDDAQRSVGYDKVARLAAHYNVTTDFLLGLSNDPHCCPCAVDELQLSNGAVEAIRFYAEETGDALHGLDRLLNSMDFGAVCLMVERLKKSVDALQAESYPACDVARQHAIEAEIIASHPELHGRIKVLYGDVLTYAIAKDAIRFFEMSIEQVTGLSNRRLRKERAENGND